MTEETKKHNKQEQPQAETKIQDKKETAKKEEKKKLKKNYAVVRGLNLHMSVKEGMSICNMIRNHDVDTAIKDVEEVLVFRKVVKMNNRQVSHKHGKGIMAGRYPLVTGREILRLLKNLKANALYHEVELEKARLTLCKVDKASRPYKRGGARAKRANVLLKLEMKKENKQEKKK